jgi:hypothetical protein
MRGSTLSRMPSEVPIKIYAFHSMFVIKDQDCVYTSSLGSLDFIVH